MAHRSKKKNASLRALLVILLLVLSVTIGYNYFFPRKQFNRITEIGSLPSGFISHGIDISHYQGEIDWELFNSDSLIGFVYCKSTEGNSLIDEKWKEYATELANKEIAFGAYHFFHPSIDPIAQADHYLKVTQLNSKHLSPVIDVETDEHHADFITNIGKWLQHVWAKSGRQPIIYTSYHLYKTKLKDAFPSYHFWIANYSNRADRFINDSLVIHWQYSESGKVAGINQPVDLNYSKIDFSKN